ncbi:MAG: sulfotransferase domain-containing protein [Phycisphaerales bacterium]|nr:MAG: sulfotransferase domain-containing protein [Phycisphaerales bacterium]
MSDICDNRRFRWLVGYPKSGTTWVRMFLNAVCSGFPLDINSPFQYAASDMTPCLYHTLSAAPMARLDRVWFAYYRPAALANALLMSHTRDLVLRTHWPKVRINGTAMHPPELSRCAVVVVRDPRDVAVSLAAYLDKTVDEVMEMMGNDNQALERDHDGLYHFLSSWSTHVDSWTTANEDIPCDVVRYEDLLVEPRTAFRKIADLIGPRNVSAERLEWAMEQARFTRLQDQEQARGFRERKQATPFFRRGEAGVWREVLSSEQAAAVEERHGEVMERVGYNLEHVNTGGKC